MKIPSEYELQFIKKRKLQILDSFNIFYIKKYVQTNQSGKYNIYI